MRQFTTAPGCLGKYLRISFTTFLLATSTMATAQAFPDSVKEFAPGRNAGFGEAYFPANVLGPPNGTSDPHIPNESQTDLLSLGTGGHIVLEFTSNQIVDAPGPDFTIFENPVEPNGSPDQIFADTAVVAVSSDGVTWHTFPFDMISSASADVRLKSNFTGLAGLKASLSSPSNQVSPFDPSVSGGDQFDLADVNLPSARFIKITDSGDTRYNPQYDTQGDAVTDYGNIIDPDPTHIGVGISSGFDLDAVAAINTEPWSAPSAVSEWVLYD